MVLFDHGCFNMTEQICDGPLVVAAREVFRALPAVERRGVERTVAV